VRGATLRIGAARALLAADAAAGVPAVAELLRDGGSLPDLYLLVHMLAGTGRPEALPVLADALRRSGDRSVRCHAATGLGGFRDATGVDALAAAAVGDEYPAVRVNALRALARAASPERVREVAERVAASDADASVRTVARELAPAAERR
jgi:HEAT repeat protein